MAGNETLSARNRDSTDESYAQGGKNVDGAGEPSAPVGNGQHERIVERIGDL